MYVHVHIQFMYQTVTLTLIELILGWLQPLLHEIASNSSHVVSPLIANIVDETFELRFPPVQISSKYRFFIGGFDWGLQVSHMGVLGRLQELGGVMLHNFGFV